MIQVVAPRENSAIALGGGLGQRLLPAPGLHHDVARQVRMQHLVPADQDLAALLEQFLHALVEISLDGVRVLQVVLFRKRLHARRGVPLFGHHFIAADVEIRVREERRHLLKKGVEERVGFFAARVERVLIHAPFAPDLIRPRVGPQFRIPHQPCRRMAGDVEFRHHANAAVARVGHHAADLVLGVEQAVGALLMQFGETLALHAETLVLGEVPVKHVELHGSHRVQIALHHFERHPMARRIHHQPAPGKAWFVLDVDGRDLEAVLGQRDELPERLQAVQRAGTRWRLEQGALAGHIQRVGFVLAERRVVAARARALDAQFGCGVLEPEHGDPRLPGETHHEASDGRLQPGVRRAHQRRLERGIQGKLARGGPHRDGQRHQRGRRRERRGDQCDG